MFDKKSYVGMKDDIPVTVCCEGTSAEKSSLRFRHSAIAAALMIISALFAIFAVTGCSSASSDDAGQLISSTSQEDGANDEDADLSGDSAAAISYTELPDGVAATVNGVNVEESTITDYIQKIRESSELTEEKAWAEWLISFGYTPEHMRNEIIGYFVNDEATRQLAEKEGVTVSDEEVDAAIQAEIDLFDSEDEWLEMLKENNMTKEEYRNEMKLTMLEDAIIAKSLSDVKAEDEEVLSYINDNYSDYAEATSLEAIPADIVDEGRESTDDDARIEAYEELLENFKSEGEILIGAMPDGLPYVIDMTPYEQAAAENAAANAGEDSAEASEDEGDIEFVDLEEGDVIDVENDLNEASDSEDEYFLLEDSDD